MNDLKFAIEMELEGEKYYRQQAELNKNNSLYKVCILLAEDEKNHAKILAGKLDNKDYGLTDTDTLSKAKSIFKGVGDIKGEWKENLTQLDLYRVASDKEKQSIDLYSGFLSRAANDQEKALFEYLIKQEKQHFEIFDSINMLLTNAEEWVEDAEFGLRKDY